MVFRGLSCFRICPERGLLVLGYPKDSYWKLSAYKTIVSIKIDAIGFIAVFFLNIGIVLLLLSLTTEKQKRLSNLFLLALRKLLPVKKHSWQNRENCPKSTQSLTMYLKH